MFNNSNLIPNGWLAFELNVLRRLKFATIAIPFSAEAKLGAYLKRWNIRVLANDPTQWAWTRAVAEIENNTEILSEEDLATVLEDAYVPRHRLQNPALKKWFNETDSWWFDNVRQNIEKLGSPTARCVALSIGLGVGDYVMSFNDDTRNLRQPLSNIYKRLYLAQPAPVNNGKVNTCSNKPANEFIAENYTDLLFLRLPRAYNSDFRNSQAGHIWREEWIRGSDDFWESLDSAQANKLGTHVITKSQYLELLEDALKTASHIQSWAIAHVEDGFIPTQEVIETVSQVRRVDTIFTKDFSELTGTKATIITA